MGYPEIRVTVALVVMAGISAIVAWRAPNPEGTIPKYALFWSGLVVSLVFGLSASPLIAACATGVFSVAAAGVAIWTGTATLDALTRWSSWSLPFFAAFLIGVPCGIVVRANDLLSFRTRHLPFELGRMGFSETQVEELMTQLAKSPEKISKVAPEPDRSGRSNLISAAEIASLKDQVASVKKNAPDDASEQVKLLRAGGGEEIGKLIELIDSLFDDDSTKMRVLDAISASR